SMSKPRRENRPDTLASTPGTFSTNTLRVWVLITFLPVAVSRRTLAYHRCRGRDHFAAPSRSRVLTRSGRRVHRALSPRCLHIVVIEQRADTPRGHDLVVAGPRGNHRPHLGVLAHHKVDHYRSIVDRHGLFDHGIH